MARWRLIHETHGETLEFFGVRVKTGDVVELSAHFAAKAANLPEVWKPVRKRRTKAEMQAAAEVQDDDETEDCTDAVDSD